MRYELKGPRDLDLSKLEGDALRAVDEAFKASVVMIANDAKRSIANGPKTGRVYTHYYRTNPATGGIFPVERRTPHQASAPGEAPATDTGRLISSIVADAAYNGTRFKAVVEVRAAYGVYLEYGTRKIMPRPFLIPAVERNRPRLDELVRRAVQTATQRFSDKWFREGAYSGAFPGSDVRTEREARFWAWRFRD